MSGRQFPEKISPFLRRKCDELCKNYGPEDPRYLGLVRQYVRLPEEEAPAPEENLRHYDAEVVGRAGEVPRGIERLYLRTVVIELTMACAARCRYCLRQAYEPHTLTEAEITSIAQFCGSAQLRDDVHEVLVTGGDPFLVPQRLSHLIDSLVRYAPSVSIMRIATRLPQQDPARVGNAVFDVFRNRHGIRFEIATQTNHTVEFFPEVRECFSRLMDVVPTVYSQNVLLKGVNDNVDALVELYDTMRSMGIGPHYLFHPVPMRWTHHFRTSVEKALALARHLTSCGLFSGRAKPIFSLMTDVGKIALYEGSILDRDRKRNRILLRSHYRLEDRVKWNASWTLPPSASVDEKGYLQVWYLDGSDE